MRYSNSREKESGKVIRLLDPIASDVIRLRSRGRLLWTVLTKLAPRMYPPVLFKDCYSIRLDE